MGQLLAKLSEVLLVLLVVAFVPTIVLLFETQLDLLDFLLEMRIGE